MDFTVKELSEMSFRVRNWLRENKTLPTYVNSKNNTLKVHMRNFLYLACKATLAFPNQATISLPQDYPEPGPRKEWDDTVQGNIPRTEYLKIAQDIVNLYESKNRPPEYASPVSIGTYMSFKNLIYMFSMILAYWYESGNIAKWAAMDIFSKADEKKLNVIHDRQDDKCRCCPSTLYMIFNYYGVPVTEENLADAMGTSDTTTDGSGCSGTAPSKVKVAVDYVNRKFGRNFKYENKYLSDVGGINGLKEYIKKGIPVCLHVDEGGFDWANSHVGHYVPYIGFKTGYSWINDPYFVEGSEKWEADQYVIDAINLKTGYKSLHVIYE